MTLRAVTDRDAPGEDADCRAIGSAAFFLGESDASFATKSIPSWWRLHGKLTPRDWGGSIATKAGDCCCRRWSGFSIGGNGTNSVTTLFAIRLQRDGRYEDSQHEGTNCEAKADSRHHDHRDCPIPRRLVSGTRSRRLHLRRLRKHAPGVIWPVDALQPPATGKRTEYQPPDRSVPRAGQGMGFRRQAPSERRRRAATEPKTRGTMLGQSVRESVRDPGFIREMSDCGCQPPFVRAFRLLPRPCFGFRRLYPSMRTRPEDVQAEQPPSSAAARTRRPQATGPPM